MLTKKMLYLLSAAVLPALITSCSTKKEEVKAEQIPVPKQEVKAEPKAEPKFTEHKTETKAEAKPAPVQETKAEAKPAPVQETKAEVKPVKQAPVLPCKHTVAKGENLWKISVQYYGKGAKWPKILEANKSTIKNMDLLTPGMVLNIPADK